MNCCPTGRNLLFKDSIFSSLSLKVRDFSRSFCSVYAMIVIMSNWTDLRVGKLTRGQSFLTVLSIIFDNVFDTLHGTFVKRIDEFGHAYVFKLPDYVNGSVKATIYNMRWRNLHAIGIMAGSPSTVKPSTLVISAGYFKIHPLFLRSSTTASYSST